MKPYEIVIVQEKFDVDPDLIHHLSSLGRQFSIVRPHADDVSGGVVQPNYCAVARNEAMRFATGEWVVFLGGTADLDAPWFRSLEQDLAQANVKGAVASVAGGVEPSATRANDIAYRRDALESIGGFAETDDSTGMEDFLAQLRLVADGGSVVQGRRHCYNHHA